MRNPRRFTSAVALLIVTAAPFALLRASEAAPPKPGGAKGGASASASATTTSAPTAAATSTTTSMTTSDDAPPSASSANTAAAAAAASSAKPTDSAASDSLDKEDPNDPTEKPHQTYYFVGARYRGTIVPKFMMNLFVGEGATVYSNTAGIELDMRKDGESKVFALSYVEYGTGDILFLQKGKNADDPGNWSYVNSSLKAIYATVDLLWSVPIDHKRFEFEYGFGAGIGFLFGDLVNNWVTPSAGPNGQLNSADGKYHFDKCTAEGPIGCNKGNHQNADTAKVGPTGYVEKSWFSGGSVPNVFLHLALPQLGLRFKPMKQMEARLGLGFSLTGFWFGLSGDYGLEKPDKKSGDDKTGSGPSVHFGRRY